MPDAKSSKGNPASTRMSNAALKTRRSLSWQRGEKRKAERIKEQEAAARRNRQEPPGYSPWETAQNVRREKRRQRRAMGMLPVQPRNSEGMIIKRIIVGGEPHEVLVKCCDRCVSDAVVQHSLAAEAERKGAARSENKAARAASKAKRADKAETKAERRARGADKASALHETPGSRA